MDDRNAAFSLDLVYDIDLLTVTVKVPGDIDLLTAPALAGALHPLLDGDRRRIVIDLARCGFVDARGITVLTDVAHRAAAVGGMVIVRSASSIVRRMLDITGVSELIELSDAAETELLSAGVSGGRGVVAAASPTGDSAPVPSSMGLVRSSTEVVDAALRLVTALAGSTVTNADGVSVTLERHGRLMTVAASNDKVKNMDRHQYETGEGPCLEAKAQDRWYYIESLDVEKRWPHFVPLALEQGIHSILASPLKTRDQAQGSLNIYSAMRQAFGEREQELAGLFAGQASQILTAAAPESTDDDTDLRFNAALAARQRIHQAQGVLMARDEMSAADAIAALYRAARTAEKTVVAYATELLDSLRTEPGAF